MLRRVKNFQAFGLKFFKQKNEIKIVYNWTEQHHEGDAKII